MPLSTLGGSRSLAVIFTPIKSGALVDEVCRRIELAIESGLLVSGQRLPNETEIGGALGVSSVTTREALSQLRKRGLIRTTRGRNGGSFVTESSKPSAQMARDRLRSMTRSELIDLSLHYEAITVACAGAAALRGSTEEAGALRRLIRPATDPGKPATAFAWRLAISDFLLQTATMAKSARLARELMLLQADVGAMTLLPFEDSAVCESVAFHCESIADAIENHDSAAAERLTKESTKATMAMLLALQEAVQAA